jgi:hypothetical protein
MYDKIYIGTSIPMLFYIYSNLKKDEKILILNKEKYSGGSWFTISNKYCNDFDTAGHFIIIRNKEKVSKIKSLFKNLNIAIGAQNAVIHNPNYKFINNSNIFYPKEGWDKIIKSLTEKIGINNFSFENEVIDINIDNYVEIKINTKDGIKNINTKKVIIPSYIKLDKIKIKNHIIDLDYELCNTYHVIFYCKIVNNHEYNNSFHGFYEGDLLFDRLTCVCNEDKMNNITNVNQLLIFRVSRTYKNIILEMNKTEIIEHFFEFIKKKNINIKNIQVKDIEIFTYEFYYRQEYINDLIKKFNAFRDKVAFVNTTDLGLLIEKITY